MLKQFRYTFFVTTLFFCWVKLNAQLGGTSFRNVVNVGPISPEAASLGKFGNVPVGYYTGTPQISIPVYDIKVGSINLPVSLDYHAAGIRIDETSSSVGIGWALSGPGIISRNILGKADEAGNYIGTPNAETVVNAPAQHGELILGIKNGGWDAEPDIFQYNVNGLSGKFIFRNDGSIMQIPVTNNKIEFITGANFKITDPNGVQYFFEEKRMSSFPLSEIEYGLYPTTWCLTKVIDVNAEDIIYFTYEPPNYISYQTISNFTYVFGNTVNLRGVVCTLGTIAEEAYASEDIGPHQTAQQIGHYEFYPKEIKWRNGKVVFIHATGRTDITGSGLRLDQIEVYAGQTGNYTLVKKAKLNQSYIYSPPSGNGTPTEKNYRLKLDNVAQLDVSNNAPVQVYRMEYNNTPIAPRESYAQDRWGFNNGHTENSDLMPKQYRNYKGVFYNFGQANRETDDAKMLAGTLTSIEYPTRGKTVFEFKPHKYAVNIQRRELRTQSSRVCCGTNSSLQYTFTVPNNSSLYSYKAFISKYNFPGITERPTIYFRDQTTNQVIVQMINMTPDQDYYTNNAALGSLTPGHTYVLDINIYTTNPNVSASFDLTWEETLPDPILVSSGGGLRVESITNYDIAGNFINKEVYQYGDDGKGVILTPQYYQDINYETVVHRVGYRPCGVIFDLAYEPTLAPNPGFTTIYHANSVLPTTYYSGSPVVYRKVTKMDVDISGNPKGKTVYGFGVYQDGAFSPFEPIKSFQDVYDPKPGMYLITKNWKNGQMESEEIYRSAGSGFALIKKTENKYIESLTDAHKVLKVKPKYLHTGMEVFEPNDFHLTAVPYNTGAMILSSTTETLNDELGNMLDITKNFTYGSTPLLPSKIETTNSTGLPLTENLQYPKDLAAPGNVYKKMDDRNIIAPVVTRQQLLNNDQQSYTATTYTDINGDSKLLLPEKVDLQIASNPPETKVRFNKYDKYGNILQQQKEYDVYQSYIWDYNAVYPIAQCVNADHSSIAYTSFEADGAGSWTIGSNSRTTNDGITGNTCYQISDGSISKTGLNSSTTYIVSYWRKNGGALSVSGTQGSVVQGKNINGWTYFEHRVTGVSEVTLPQTAGLIDELRLYPANAQMTTYTFTPLVGMTSGCSANNIITYYEYDGFQRLKLIKDEHGNIVKTFEYHYKQ